HRLIPRIRGQRPIGVGPDAVPDKAHTAVAEQEIAAARVQTPKPADKIETAGIVAFGIAAEDRGRRGPAVHRLLARIGGPTLLSCYGKERAVPRAAAVGDAGGAPRLLEDHGLTRLWREEDLIRGVDVADEILRRAGGGVAHGEGRAGPVGDLKQANSGA